MGVSPPDAVLLQQPERTTSDRDAMMRFQMALEAISEMDVQVRQDAVAMKRVAKKALGTD